MERDPLDPQASRGIEEILAQRARVADAYTRRLARLEHVTPPAIARWVSRMSWFVYVVRLAPWLDRDAVIRRLEIPHGRFVREIALSGPPLRVADTRYLNGCLEVRLVWAEGVR